MIRDPYENCFPKNVFSLEVDSAIFLGISRFLNEWEIQVTILHLYQSSQEVHKNLSRVIYLEISGYL